MKYGLSIDTVWIMYEKVIQKQCCLRKIGIQDKQHAFSTFLSY